MLRRRLAQGSLDKPFGESFVGGPAFIKPGAYYHIDGGMFTEGGHNNFFLDHQDRPWATFFRNPAAGYWSNAVRVADAAVAGVVRLEWTGPQGNRLYVQRPPENQGRR